MKQRIFWHKGNGVRIGMDNYVFSVLFYVLTSLLWRGEIDPLAFHFGAPMLSATCNQTCPEVDQKDDELTGRMRVAK